MSVPTLRRVLVTGAGGFLGGHVARHLARSGYPVRAIVRRPAKIEPGDPIIEWFSGDICNSDDLKRALSDVWGVIHCASWVHLGVDPKGLSTRVNVDATRELLVLSAATGVERFVYTSSLQTIAAGTFADPATEESAWNLHSVRSPYIASKRAAETLVLQQCGRMKTIALCPGMIIGPRDPGPTSTRVLLLMSRSTIAFLPAGGIPVIDARVAAEAHQRALESNINGERFALIGPYLSYRDQSRLVAKIAGRPRWIVPLADFVEPIAAPFAGAIDRVTAGASLSVSRAAIAGGFLRFHVSGDRADAAFELTHPAPIDSIFDTLEDAKRAGRAPWLRTLSRPANYRETRSTS